MQAKNVCICYIINLGVTRSDNLLLRHQLLGRIQYQGTTSLPHAVLPKSSTLHSGELARQLASWSKRAADRKHDRSVPIKSPDLWGRIVGLPCLEFLWIQLSRIGWVGWFLRWDPRLLGSSGRCFSKPLRWKHRGHDVLRCTGGVRNCDLQ